MCLLAVCAAAGGARQAWAAETAHNRPATKTLVVLKLETPDPLDIRTSFQEIPPTLRIEFPTRRVTGTLPERSAIQQAAIREIRTRYTAAPMRASTRFIESVELILTAPYGYQVSSEPGQVVVEIAHPASVGGAAFEVGLLGGTVIRSMGAARISERFRAMQEAMVSATPTAWVFRFPQEPPRPSTPSGAQARSGDDAATQAMPARTDGKSRVDAESPAGQKARSRAGWFTGGIALTLLLGTGGWLAARPRMRARLLPESRSRPGRGLTGSAAELVDQLVWQSFERQGYQLMRSVQLEEPPGLLRVITKDGARAGLLCVGNGAFYEKQAVERFVAALRELNVTQGFLAAAGSFTVPAQRVAKAHQIALIGREELTELLGAGAASEHVARQLSQLQARLDESKETLRQYANELDTLRRQRNEASWYLGEERARLGKLEAELETARQELRQQHVELQRWQAEGTTQRRQWEESEWYLGESRARIRHLETQLGALQEAAARAEMAEHDREEIERQLAAAQQQRASLEEQLSRLEQTLADALRETTSLKDELEELKRSYVPMSLYGERRRLPRRNIPEATVELWNASPEPLFAGTPRDLCSQGMGLDSPRELPSHGRVRVRLLLPGVEPVESHAQQVWQRTELDPLRYLSGYRLLGLPAGARQRIDAFLKTQAQP